MTWQRGNHHIERVGRAAAMGRGIGERIDDLQLLDDRARPPMRDDDRQRIFMFRTNVNEMDVQSVDFGDELRQGVQPRLHLAPVVAGHPVVREVPDGCQLHALRMIGYGFLIGPPRRFHTPPQIDELLFRNVDAEGADCAAFGRSARLHADCTF